MKITKMLEKKREIRYNAENFSRIPMIEKKVIVQNRAGVHARPSTLIAQAANKFEAKIEIIKGEKEYNAKSVIGVMTMAATYNSELTLRADGADEQAAIDAIVQLFDTKFEED